MAPRSLQARSSLRPRRDDDRALLERFFMSRDPRDREALMERFRPLAVHLSHRYFSAGEDEDLQQVASLALLQAIDRFDPTRGGAFTSFAVPTILGALKRHFRDHGWSVRVPRALQELVPRVTAASEALAREHGRSPTVQEIAERCQTTAELVVEARMLTTAHRAISLDAPTEESESTNRLEMIGGEDDAYQRAEEKMDFERRLKALSDRERTIVRLRFSGDLTQSQIAKHVGLSQMHVSRLLRSALGALGQPASADTWRL